MHRTRTVDSDSASSDDHAGSILQEQRFVPILEPNTFQQNGVSNRTDVSTLHFQDERQKQLVGRIYWGPCAAIQRRAFFPSKRRRNLLCLTIHRSKPDVFPVFLRKGGTHKFKAIPSKNSNLGGLDGGCEQRPHLNRELFVFVHTTGRKRRVEAVGSVCRNLRLNPPRQVTENSTRAWEGKSGAAFVAFQQRILNAEQLPVGQRIEKQCWWFDDEVAHSIGNGRA